MAGVVGSRVSLGDGLVLRIQRTKEAAVLIDELKRRLKEAMKTGRTIEKEILRVALGEIQTIEARSETNADDQTAISVIKKLVKANEETLQVSENADQRRALEEELVVLRSLLPDSMSVDQIVEALAPLVQQLKAAGNDGQATGIAMKHLKSSGAAVEGKQVAEAVRRIRSLS
jgi:hypothetical protein